MFKKNYCRCDHCKLSRLARRKLRYIREEDRKFWDYILTLLMNIELDKEVAEAILDGSWPNSFEILQRSLERARELDPCASE